MSGPRNGASTASSSFVEATAKHGDITWSNLSSEPTRPLFLMIAGHFQSSASCSARSMIVISLILGMI
jgi:hypothetical protein